jgi:Ca2+-binding EF-hand superfamily protein
VFKAFDTDNSGEIDFVEFLRAVSIISQGTVKDKLKLSFSMFDIDKNGKIDAKEMATLIDAIYDLVDEKNRTGENSSKEKVKRIMSKLDMNNDGKLTLDEFIDGCLKDEHLRVLLCPALVT